MPGYAWRHRISNILEAIGKEINTVFARQFHGMYLKLKLKCLDNDPSLLNSILAIDKDFKQDDDILPDDVLPDDEILADGGDDSRLLDLFSRLNPTETLCCDFT